VGAGGLKPPATRLEGLYLYLHFLLIISQFSYFII